ncbi:MAG TPA: phosphoglucosamine mutase [Candidatus Atribacteria bacterium]|nr:MAG: Phosphoglucosamine mutase [Atribacteria bacterium 34_128]HAJ33831.1 phosphoglucosamine mutase [Candidatus Atribacteria bacterium]
MKKLFGTDGIRGIANREPMTAEVAFHIGRAGAYLFKDEINPKILIGRDTRISGDMLEAALIAGICSMGVNVLRVGIMPTPVVAYLTRAYNANCGIVISASHNSFDHNGIKYIRGDGFKFTDSEEEEIERIYFKNHSKDEWPTEKNIGRLKELSEAEEKYIDYIKSTLPSKFTLKGYKIVLDCANGASYLITPRVFKELGAEIITINDKPNGININYNCGSVHPTSLRKEVLRQKADLGFSYDGDADRVIAVDEKGNIVDGDQIMAICALNLIKKAQLPNKTVVTTLMSNIGFNRAIEKAGGKVIKANIGDRYVLEMMKKVKTVLGGEQSGHVIFSQYSTTGDGLLTSLQLMKVLQEEEKHLSNLASVMEKYPQIILNYEVKDKERFFKNICIKKFIKEIEKELDGKGRIFVRASGTEPLIRILLEGEDKNKLEKISQDLREVIEKEDI